MKLKLENYTDNLTKTEQSATT